MTFPLGTLILLTPSLSKKSLCGLLKLKKKKKCVCISPQEFYTVLELSAYCLVMLESKSLEVRGLFCLQPAQPWLLNEWPGAAACLGRRVGRQAVLMGQCSTDPQVLARAHLYFRHI